MSKNNWFYYFEGAKAVGPLEKADVLERIQHGKLGPYQLMIRDGDDEWQPALSFAEFREALLGVKTNREPFQSWIILKRQDAGGHLAVESLGPFTSEEVREALQAGKIEYTDYAWKDGMHQWRRVSSLKEFSPFEKAVETPKPRVTMPPAPKIAKEVTKSDVLKKVEVVSRVVEKPKPPMLPKLPPEADGPDLAKTVVIPPAKPVVAPPVFAAPPIPEIEKVDPPKTPLEVQLSKEDVESAHTVVAPPPVAVVSHVPVAGSPTGEERRRLPRATKIEVKEATSPEVPVEPKPSDEPPLARPRPSKSKRDKTALGSSRAVPSEPPPMPGSSLPLSSAEEEPQAPVPFPRNSRARDNDDENGTVRKETVTNAFAAAKEFGDKRITLPRNWKQILFIVVLLLALYVKLFSGPDTIPLSQVPQFSTDPAPAPAPMPDPSSMNAPSAPDTDASTPDKVAGNQEVGPVTTATPDQETSGKPSAAPKKKSRPATKLRAHMVVQGEQTSLQVETDAGVDQVVTIEVSALAGQVVEHSHYFHRSKWTPGKPLDMGGTLPAGYYHMHVSVGSLTADEKFEVGTKAKGFADRLKASRKQSAYEFWSERKKLLLVSRQVGKLLGSRQASGFNRLSQFDPTKFAFADLWTELKEICQLGKKSDPSAKDRLAALQNKISQLSVWR